MIIIKQSGDGGQDLKIFKSPRDKNLIRSSVKIQFLVTVTIRKTYKSYICVMNN